MHDFWTDYEVLLPSLHSPSAGTLVLVLVGLFVGVLTLAHEPLREEDLASLSFPGVRSPAWQVLVMNQSTHKRQYTVSWLDYKNEQNEQIHKYIMANLLPFVINFYLLWDKSPSHSSKAGVQPTFCKGPECKYFRLCGTWSLPQLLGSMEATVCEHTQYVNKRVWLCFNKTLYAKIGICWIWPVIS